MKSLIRQKEFNIFLIVVLISIVLTIVNPKFLTIGNLLDVIKGNVVMGILALGMTFVIITGGIDVSVAAVTTAVTVTMGGLFAYMPDSWISILLIFIISPLVGTALGLLNGFFVSRINIPAIVVTLGTFNLITGLVLYITNGRYLNSSHFPKSFLAFANYNFLGVSILIYILVILSILSWYILNHTQIGRSILAIGGNKQSAIRVGIEHKKVLFFVYGFMGFLAGFAAIAQTGYTKAVDPNGLLGLELMVIASVVVGGTSIQGGRGTIQGTLLGVLLMAILENGMILAHIDTFWQKVVIGAVILIAVSYDQISYRRQQAKLERIQVDA